MYNIDIDSSRSFSFAIVPSGQTRDAYFVKGTVLYLYYVDPSLNSRLVQATEVLQQDTTLFFCNGLWRNAPCPVALTGLEAIVKAFYNNLANPRTATPPSTVYNDMTNYMGFYLQYATNGFSPGSPARISLQTLTTNLNNDIRSLVQ